MTSASSYPEEEEEEAARKARTEAQEKAPATRSELCGSPQQSQFAADAQSEEIITGYSNGEDEEVGTAELGGPAPEEVVGARAAVDEFVAVASVRYCAALNDGKPVLEAADSAEDVKVRSLTLRHLWRWFDRAVKELKPRTVSIVNLCASVYPRGRKKTDSQQKRIVRDERALWGEFQHLAKHVGLIIATAARHFVLIVIWCWRKLLNSSSCNSRLRLFRVSVRGR